MASARFLLTLAGGRQALRSHSPYRSVSSSTPQQRAKEEEKAVGSAGVKITAQCKARLVHILDEPGTFLRVGVEGGGCSGFQYKFQIDNRLESDDVVVLQGQKEGAAAQVVTDPTSLDLLRGSTLHYETELIRSSFRILDNPVAQDGCSCGASFNMKL